MAMILLLLAVFPSIYLMRFIYNQDKVEKEPIGLMAKIFLAGIFAVIPAFFAELVMQKFFFAVFPNADNEIYLLLENFIGIALIEEYCKRFMVRKVTWNCHDFNYSFDGIVYCVCASLGFATLENIMYVFSEGGGVDVAVVRALMSIPLHAFCGVYMGYYYGLAKQASVNEYEAKAETLMTKSLIVPVLIHGAYDFILSVGNDSMMLAIVIFCIVIDFLAIKRVKDASRDDMPLWF